MSSSGATRIAISQFVVFTILTYVSVTLSLTLNEEHGPHHHVTRRALMVISGCFLFVIFLSIMLLFGVLKNKPCVIRIWLISNIPLNIALLFLLLSDAVYLAAELELYWSIFYCTMPFVLTFWMTEGVIVVYAYYRDIITVDINKLNPL